MSREVCKHNKLVEYDCEECNQEYASQTMNDQKRIHSLEAQVAELQKQNTTLHEMLNAVATEEWDKLKKEADDWMLAYDTEKEFCMRVMAERDKLKDQNARMKEDLKEIGKDGECFCSNIAKSCLQQLSNQGDGK